jgi:hypothetical protein
MLGADNGKAGQFEQRHCQAGTGQAKNRQKHDSTDDSANPATQEVGRIKQACCSA